MNGRPVVEARHAKIRLIVQRLAACDAKGDSEFGGKRHKNRMAKRARGKGVFVVLGVGWFDRE